MDDARMIRNPWLIVFLLFLVQVINFFDKGVVGLAALPIMKELALSRTQFSLVASSFFSLYAVSGIVTALLLANRLRPKWLLAFLVLVWSLAQIPILFTGSLSVLIMCRVLLGIGEGPATPTSYNACFGWFASDKRNIPLAVITLGSGLGTLIGAPVLTFFILNYGWRSAFFLCGALGFIWLIVWSILGANGPYGEKPAATLGTSSPIVIDHVSASLFWTDPTIIASIVVGFCTYWTVGFNIAWMPAYLQTALGYDATTTGWLMSGISTASSGLTFVMAWVSQRMLGAGRSSRVARGLFNGISLVVAAALLIGSVTIGSGPVKLVLLALGFAIPLVTFSIGPTIIAEVAPPSLSRRAILLVYSGITLAGFVSPLAAGYLVNLAGPTNVATGYNFALSSIAALLFAGGLTGTLWLRPEATIRKFAGLQAALD